VDLVLSKTDVSKLNNEITFVVSRGYKRKNLNITYLFYRRYAYL